MIRRTVFFRAWSSSERDQSFHCLLLQKLSWFLIQDWRQRHKSYEYPQQVPQMLEMNSSLPACSWSTSVNPPQTNPDKHKYPLLSLLSESFIKSITEPLLENKVKVTLPAWKEDTGQNSAAKRTMSWQTLKGAVTDVPLGSDTCTSPESALRFWFQCQVWLFQV